MSDILETEIDGVLCFFVDLGRPLSSAHLVFRQGEADEPLCESGWLHLLQHMALRDRSGGPVHVTGELSLLTTSFAVRGTTDATMQTLLSLTSWLAEPDLNDLARERLFVQGQTEVRDDRLRRSLRWLFGAEGPGVAGFGEPGAVRATEQSLVERAQQVFNGSAAVLVLDAPPPPGIKLRLPYGQYAAPAPATPSNHKLPAAYVEERGLVLAGVVQRSLEADLVAGLLGRGVHDGLRNRVGSADAPWSAIEPVDDLFAVVAGGSDLTPDLLPTVVDMGLDIAATLATDSARNGWLQEEVDLRLAVLHAPDAALGVALKAAEAVLSGQVPQSHQELVDALRTVDPARVADKVGEFADTLLVGVPEDARLSATLDRIGFPDSLPTEGGLRHHHVDWPADASTFSADEHCLQYVAADGRATTQPVGDVVGLLVWRDGTREAIGRDGSQLQMDARQWQESDDLTRAIDQVVPEHLHLLRPDRAVTFQPMKPGERWLGATLRWADTSRGLGVLAGLFALLSVLWVLGGNSVPAVTFLAVAAILGGRVWLRERGSEAPLPTSPA